jgi:outer membrane receptor protein involved in Fe transport
MRPLRENNRDVLEGREMPNRNKSTLTGVAALLASVLAASAGFAQDQQGAGASALEEVVVTAQRREESLQAVPISVSVFSRAGMDAQGTRVIDDIARLTPAVTFVRSANNNNSESSDIAIRGIASNAGASTTGVYIDDTPIQSRHIGFPSFTTYPALFDIERVEVLRGPQGSLFGAGSEGGTIRFITPEPGLDKYSMYARSEVGVTQDGDPVYELGVAGGGPIVDGKAGFRGSVSYRHEGGYVDRVNWHTQQLVDDAANSSDTMTARLAVKWAAGDAVSITPSILYQKRDVDDTAAWWSPRPGEPDPTNGQFNSPFRTGNAVAQPSTDKFVLPALKIEWDLGALRFVSSTSYFKREQSAITDYTQFDRAIFLGSPYPPAVIPAFGIDEPVDVQASGFWKDDQENWTQELRLESADPDARVTWTAGLFYQRAKETTSHKVYDPQLLIDFGIPGFGSDFIYVESPRVGTDKQLAAFGQADVRLTDKLKLTLGLRYAQTEFEGEAFYPETLVVGPEVFSSGKLKEHPVTPKIGLNYQLDADNLLYATVAKGFRIGGSNAAVGQFCFGPGSTLESIGLSNVPPTFSSDTVWSYEIGTKNSFADQRVLLNASAYLVKWNDIQQNVGLSCGFQFTSNLGEAESRGFDIQAQARVTDAISLGGTFAYTDAKFTKTVQLQPTVQSIVRDGDHLGGSPWTAVVFGQVDFPVYGREAYVRADYQYSAQQTDRVAAQNPLNGGFALWVPSVPVQSFTSLRAGVKWDRLDVSLFAQNLFDTRPRLTDTQDIATPAGGTPLFYVITWRPRTVGLTATYRF